MKRFTDAGRRAIVDENWYAALTTALIIPDICGSMEQPGPGKSQKRYVDWCRTWLQPKFTRVIAPNRPQCVFLSAEELFQARCSVIHSGSAEIDMIKRERLDQFVFFSDGPHLNFVTGNVVNGVAQPNFLQLRVDEFCESVFEAADEWDVTVGVEPKIQAEKAKLLVIHAPGAVIGGIQWGKS